MINTHMKDKIAKMFLWISASCIIIILLGVLGYLFINGINELNIDFLTSNPKKNWGEGGIFPAIEGTLAVVFISILIATPLGVGTALYLTEFTKESWITHIMRIAADSLNAVPSIVFGLFGLAFFVTYLKEFTGGPTLLSACLTLAIMILPTIIRTSEMAIKTVPSYEKQGSYGLGATKLQTIRRIIIPRAIPGIVTGVVLGIGRVAGETAPIVFIAAPYLRLRYGMPRSAT